MGKRTAIIGLGILSMALLLVSCRKDEAKTSMRSVYYWSTTLNMDSTKMAFIKKYSILRMYLRYFDVVNDEAGRAMPNATLSFATKVPQGIDIVPTVFVMPECLRHDRHHLARLIVRRVLQMSQTNDVHNVREIQIDCDWTLSTRQLYDDFMRAMLNECHSRGLQLSSTIRLHQLSQLPPPADRGVLMMYNTGDATNIKCHKPILDMRDAAPYLQYLAQYRLPLSTAYPIFAWRILFRGGRFVGFVHYDGEYPMLPDDSIAIRKPSAADIMEAVKAIQSRCPDANSETILFDLSNNNINHLNHKDYETILNL
ncbi:hypothetical protein [Prevotella sp.]|uniref:hypothetical protein n=1 Tax=Prevotella sp. TaxID=59823 RepID=UPI0027E24BF6|nr:hypothetical protein [Prevotella sp.]